MKTMLSAVGLALVVSAALAAGSGPAEFSAMAKVETKAGARSMGFDLVVTNPMTMEEAEPLKEVLAKGGQQALLNFIRGSGRGQIRLGGRVYPADLVVIEPQGNGVRYYVVTERPLRFEETAEGRPSLDHPFTVFVVNVPGMGSGDGRIYPQAALSVDDEGHVRADQYDGKPGTLRDVKRLK